MVIKCEVCGNNDAEVRDYRYNGNIYDKYPVCSNCFWLNNAWFFNLKYAKEGTGKKRIMARITEGIWKDYVITELLQNNGYSFLRTCHCERSEAISSFMRMRLPRRFAPRND